jgi:hypothetical protein
VTDEEGEFGEVVKVVSIDEPLKAQILAEREAAQQASSQINQSLKFLADTDWMVIRQLETGVPVPVEILQQRAEARLLISNNRGK